MEGEEGGNFKQRRGWGEGLLKRDARRLQESPEGVGKGLGGRVPRRRRGKGTVCRGRMRRRVWEREGQREQGKSLPKREEAGLRKGGREVNRKRGFQN